MAYNQSDQYFEPSTDTNANFANSVSGQTNSFFLPAVYSKKVLNFFRKASVVEAITNTDYAGEITAYGDSVKIIKEPDLNQPHEAGLLQLNCDKAHQELNWKPTWDLEKTFKVTADWYKRVLSGENVEYVTKEQVEEYFRNMND